MKLTVLNDNLAGKRFYAEHGLSFLIEAEKKILFDVGYSDVFLKNAGNLHVYVDDVDFVVLSHGHWDHGDGLKFLKNKKLRLICHPECFVKRYKKGNDKSVGLALTHDEVADGYDLILSKKPYSISENIIFLGEIPRVNHFEAKRTSFYKSRKVDDFVIDDSALAIISGKGLVVVTGCSHAGICNIIEYAKKVTGVEQVHAVVGGFHLSDDDDVTAKTVEYFKKVAIEKIYPTHCTELPALSKFYQEFKIKQIRSGDVIDF